MPLVTPKPKRINKDQIPEGFDSNNSVYELTESHYDYCLNEKGKLFQVKYINHAGVYHTTIGRMSIDVFNIVAKLVYIP